MKQIAIALILFLSSLPALGGEWHSAGNAPVMPYKPSGQFRYKCILTGYTGTATKQYRFVIEKIFTERDFDTQWPAANLVFENTGDPGMDGHGLNFSFRKNYVDQSESMVLRISIAAKGRANSSAEFSSPRLSREVRGYANMTVNKPTADGVKWIRAVAECKDLD